MTGQKMIELIEDIGEKIEELTKTMAGRVVDYIKEQRAKERRKEII